MKKALTNHVILLVDASSSMAKLKGDVVQQVNAQFARLTKLEKTTKQKTFVSLYTFSDHTTRAPFPYCHLARVPVKKAVLDPIAYTPLGMTALNDALCQVMASTFHGSQEAVLLVTITDGQENASRDNQYGDVKWNMDGRESWSFVFLCPFHDVRRIAAQYGVPKDNIEPWEPTAAGLAKGTLRTNSGYDQYYSLRAKGAVSTQSFYTPDVKTLDRGGIDELKSVDMEYLRLVVVAKVPIKTMVERAGGVQYVPGSTYYELTKKETVQAGKDMLILDVDSNRIYANNSPYYGRKVTEVLGLPAGKEYKIEPAAHPTFRIFIQSKSVNRNLVAGTILLVKKTAIMGKAAV